MFANCKRDKAMNTTSSQKKQQIFSAEQLVLFLFGSMCLGLSPLGYYRMSKSIGVTIAIVAIVCFYWSIREAIGRIYFSRLYRYTSEHGLIIIGHKVPPPNVIDNKVREIIEWCDDNKFATELQIRYALKDVVVEFVDEGLEPTIWMLKPCPWSLLPWPDFMWIRVGLHHGKCQNISHDIMHRLILVSLKMYDPELREIEIQRLEFDIK